MTKLVNRAKMTTATTGTGTITLGSAVDGYQTFANAGVADADVVRYVIEDGDAWEIGLGTYTASGTTLTRGSIESSNADAALNLTGNAVVFVSAAAADLQELVDFADNFVLPTADGSTGQVLTTNGAGTLSFTTITGYTDADVDAHLNTGTAASGEVLSWTGSDYDWVAAPAALLGDTDSASPFETSLGFEAGNVNTGANNVFVGYRAGKANTTGYDNTVIGGRETFDVNTTGHSNVAVGSRALKENTSGRESVAVGFGALLGQTTGRENVAVGFEAGFGINTGLFNVAVGYDALTNGNGSNRTAIGHGAGRSATGEGTVAVGYQSIYVASGVYNTGIGYQTGFDLTTGANNFLGGYQAGANITTGSNNVAIGNGALDAATTGGNNIAIGQNAVGTSTVQSNIIGIGSSAAINVAGAPVVAVGNSAGTIASGNSTLVGNSAGSLASGTAVTVVGSEALFTSGSSGARATAFGYGAFRNGAVSGDDNAAIGALAGANLTTGLNNTFLGNFAGSATTTGSNQIVVGKSAEASSATVSNEITLGNSSITRFRVPGAGIDNTSAALSGTTPSVDVGARDTYTLTTSGNTTFTFTGVPSSGQVGTFSLIITAGGTHTLTWPASVDWAGGTAPDAPASGETDVYTFMTVDGGTTWYGFLAGDAMA